MKTSPAFAYARTAAKAADDKLGEDIVALDVRQQTSVADCFLFMSASSHIHVRALEDAVREALSSAGAELRRTDGQRGHHWRALDYGALIVHIMEQQTRDFYSIERLWDEAKKVPVLKSAPVAKDLPPRKGISKKKTSSRKPKK